VETGGEGRKPGGDKNFEAGDQEPEEDEGGTASPGALGNGTISAEEDAPVGPTSADEAAFLAQERAAETTASRPPAAARLEVSSESDDAPLPSLEDLVKRIPVPTRQLLDDLFRARFVTVRRVPKEALEEEG
jgi:hypothetical protein